MKIAHILTSSRRRCLLALFFVFFASFTVKVGYFVVTKVGFLHASHSNWSAWKAPGSSDTKVYYLPASEAIMAGKIFTNKDIDKKVALTLVKWPGFPFFIAIVKSITGNNIVLIRISCLLLFSLASSLSCFLAYKAFGTEVAFLTAPFAILSPLMTFWSSYILTESLFSVLLLFSIIVLVCVSKAERTNWILPLLGGIAFGYASWTRVVLIYFICLIPLWYALLRTRKKVISANLIIVFLISCMVIYLGWGVRNLIVTGSWYFPSPGSGLLGIIKGKFVANPGVETSGTQVLDIIKYGTFVSKNLLQSFIVFWHPGLYSPEMEASGQTFWNSNGIRIFVIYYLSVFSLMLISLRYICKDFAALSLLWLLILYFTIVCTVVTGWPNVSRYRVPIEPYISILAAYGLYHLYSAIRTKRNQFYGRDLKRNRPS
jgi:4-amino-4-deoxy-L-arabinose transferase-like glycosyltransferase